MNETNAKLVRYFITFSMGFVTGTFIQNLLVEGVVKPVPLIALILIAISMGLFIFRAYEDDATQSLHMYKRCADLVMESQRKLEAEQQKTDEGK